MTFDISTHVITDYIAMLKKYIAQHNCELHYIRNIWFVINDIIIVMSTFQGYKRKCADLYLLNLQRNANNAN